MLDATLMSLYWVARLPIERPSEPTSSLSPEALRRKIDRSVSDRLATVRNKRQWKIALSLAVLGALVAPFVFRTYKARPTSGVMLPLTPEQKVEWADEVEGYRNSRVCERSGERAEIDCHAQHVYERLLERGYVGPVYRFDIFKFLTINIAAAAAGFASVFALAFLIPALIRGFASLVRSYWKWLNA
jgi:hypothetical protein